MADGARRFLQFSATELKTFLRDSRVPVNEEKHAELAEKAYWAEKLDLQVKPSDEKTDQEILKCQQERLILDDGLIRLPRPETLTNGWEDSPANLPAISRDHIDSFIKAGNRRIGLEGRRILALGKGLYMSGHVQSEMYDFCNVEEICNARMPDFYNVEDSRHHRVSEIFNVQLHCCQRKRTLINATFGYNHLKDLLKWTRSIS
eukprot:XP_796183.2 PREDICTED: uncharacterized protein LOC591531 [Strongylocentrotus purpuratus]